MLRKAVFYETVHSVKKYETKQKKQILQNSTETKPVKKYQTWALALYFQVRPPLSAHFLSMDRYRSSAHFADLQVRSSLNCSKKNSGSLLEKSAKTLNPSLNYSGLSLPHPCLVAYHSHG